jgi:predicted nucleic acid-binding protein
VNLYLDTSSLVKLYVHEDGSEAVWGLLEAAELVSTSVSAYAETRAALARRYRERALDRRAYLAAKRAFETDWPAYIRLEVTDALSRIAGDLAERYRLRGYDSVHLASFLEVARSAEPAVTEFSSADARLARAGRSAAKGRARR